MKEEKLVQEEVEVVEEETKKGFFDKVKGKFNKEADESCDETEPKKTRKVLKWVGVGTALVGAGLGAYLLGKRNNSDEFEDYEDEFEEADFEDSVEEPIEE